MLKKSITYATFDGDEVTEDFYFNLTDAEIAEMELSVEGGLHENLKKMVASGDATKLIPAFKRILSSSVGKRSEDGKRFEKSPDIIDAFMQSNAFSTLFMELLTNAEDAAGFIRGIVSKRLSEKIETLELEELKGTSEKPSKNFTDYTYDELLEMSTEDFTRLVGDNPRRMSKDEMAVAMKRMMTGKDPR